MWPNHTDEGAIYTLASACEDMFADVQKALARAGSATTVHELCTEFQQRFATWTARLSIFARKSQRLDTRLRPFPDLQDLAVRLLDTLRHCLWQWKSATDQSLEAEDEVEHVQMTLGWIDDTLSRLNNLGVTIRQSSADDIDSRARNMTVGANSDLFESLCTQAVHTLYPGASQALKDRLIQSMTIRWGRIMHLGKRHEKLSTRRETDWTLETIPERPSLRPQAAHNVTRPPANDSLTDHQGWVRTRPTTSIESDLSSLNIRQIMHRSRAPDELSTNFAKTLSVQVKPGNYPKPPDNEGNSSYFTCQWCSELIDRKTLTDISWRSVELIAFRVEDA